jgi:arylsulfatase
MATCVDVSGSGYPDSHNGAAVTPLEGKSLLPVLAGGSREGHDHLCWEHEGNRGVRQGDWKIVSDYPGGFGLFNLAVDRTETTNLARQNPDKARELAQLHQAWSARVGVRPWNPVWAMQT